VGDKSTIKVHVHTLRPGAVLEYATLLGTLHDIKIDNMSEQHSENLQGLPKKPLAVVAVASGKGMEEIFTSLGVEVIVPGGQSMNPSTEDLLNAVRLAHAEEIILLPNNKNIIPAAEQLTAVADEKVAILPTKNMLQGIAAMTIFDGAKSAEDNMKYLSASYHNVTSIEVTYAVRDTVVNGLEIKKDDILALTDGVITQKGISPEMVLVDCLKKQITSDHEILTIFYGQEIFLEKVQELEKQIKEEFSNLEVEIHYGGQPIYYYLASLE
jgi:dihydroxyacetone kinase-like predicted kinase